MEKDEPLSPESDKDEYVQIQPQVIHQLEREGGISKTGHVWKLDFCSPNVHQSQNEKQNLQREKSILN